jgi:glucose dehydrogenase
MAWIGAAVSLSLSVMLPLQFRAEPIAAWYPQVHVWLYGIFYVYAVAGLALCGVGIYDRKRSAIWALLATLSLVVAAVHDTLIWFNLLSARPWVPYGFSACLLLLAVGFIRRRADLPPATDVHHLAIRNLPAAFLILLIFSVSPLLPAEDLTQSRARRMPAAHAVNSSARWSRG